MTGRSTTRRVNARTLLCAILALSFCAPWLSAEIPAQLESRPVQILALASPLSTILLNRGDSRLDRTSRLPAAGSTLVPAKLRSPAPDRGGPIGPARNPGGRSRWFARAQSGRAPPAIS